ncbi:MAG: T9SS type A sorting domain-containing protein [Chitinophagaceae bacterium]|nr:MAG: T9SS type A sorting domain-containing protein [Chitinophagaceae bacterium]
MKRFIGIACLTTIAITTQSQSVVNSTGATISNPEFSLEYSIGEISIQTVGNGTGDGIVTLTQGLLQPSVKLIDPACEVINDTVQFFPNPANRMLSVVSLYDWITGYHIYAADGKLVRVATFINNQIDLSNLASAVYFIKLFPGCNNKFRVLKVIKQ